MAMLAEPRQRKRYNLVPRGKALYDDDSRFGTKMLEKMGWSKGKGLGAKEDGALDFVRVRYKNDAEGFGYEQRDDQWTQHEDGFNGLLKSLNGEGNSDGEKADTKTITEHGNNSEDDMPRVGFGFQNSSVKDVKKKSKKPLKLKEKISGISLEEKSKQSKARVHYKKFTKGKDLSQYSEKDLANIFGKKMADEQQLVVNDFYQQLNNTFNSQPEDKETNNKDIEDTNEKLSGVQIISSGVSVSDYFKKKMEEMKNRRKANNNIENKLEQYISKDDQQDETSKKKKKKKEKKAQDLEEVNEKSNVEKEESNNTMFSSGVSVADYFKNKMEEMKKREKTNSNTEYKIEHDISSDVQENIVKKKKKNEKNKNQEEKNEMNIIEGEQYTIKSRKLNTLEVEENQLVNIKKKSMKTEVIEILKQQKLFDDISAENHPNNEADSQLEFVHEIGLTQEPEKKKRKKNRTKDSLEEIEEKNYLQYIETIPKDQPNPADYSPEFVQKIDLTQEPKKKKKKKTKTLDPLDTINVKDTPPEFVTTQIDQPSTSKQELINSGKIQKSKSIDNKSSTLDDLKNEYDLLKIYKISSFCAEKFRNINLDHFPGSTLRQVDGYGFSEDTQLDVVFMDHDEERITNMWKNTLDKYVQLVQPKKTYVHYIKDVIKARKMKQKRPKLHVKTWKRKNAFHAI